MRPRRRCRRLLTSLPYKNPYSRVCVRVEVCFPLRLKAKAFAPRPVTSFVAYRAFPYRQCEALRRAIASGKVRVQYQSVHFDRSVGLPDIADVKRV